MKFIYTLSIIISLAACASVHSNDQWEILFDGSDLSQWRSFKQEELNDRWAIKDGALTLLNTKGKRGGDIITKKQYENYDLRLEWKISDNGNSGIFLFVREEGRKVHSLTPEIQILDNERHKDNKKLSHHSGSLYDMIPAPKESQKPAGEWNSVRILLNNKLLKVWQNEVFAYEVLIDGSEWNELLEKSKFKKWKGFAEVCKGHIGLQDHGDGVSFRNIKILEL